MKPGKSILVIKYYFMSQKQKNIFKQISNRQKRRLITKRVNKTLLKAKDLTSLKNNFGCGSHNFFLNVDYAAGTSTNTIEADGNTLNTQNDTPSRCYQNDQTSNPESKNLMQRQYGIWFVRGL